MAKLPETAKEALATWLESLKYSEDPDSGVSEEDIHAEANLVVELAAKEGVSLRDLVQDEKTRHWLIEDRAAFINAEQEREKAYAEMDPPDDDHFDRLADFD